MVGRPPLLRENFDPNNPLYAARQKINNARTEFENKMRIEWQKTSTRYQDEFDRTLLNLVEEGRSIAELCRMYNTSNRATLYTLIADARANLAESFTPETRANAELHVSRDVDDWILVLAFNERVYFQDRDGFPWFLANDKDFHTNGPLATALREDADFYAKVLEIVANTDALEG